MTISDTIPQVANAMRIPIRFSIRVLLIAIAFVAVSIVALRYANNFWCSCFTFLAIVLLLSSIVGIVYSAGAKRAAWVGAAIFGGSYFMLLYIPWFRDSGIASQLPATPLAVYLHQQLVNAQVPTWQPDGTATTYNNNGQIIVRMLDASGRLLSETPLTTTLPDQSDLYQVGHAISAILMMLLGSLIARCFYETMKKERATQH
jgi:hypothetical protein